MSIPSASEGVAIPSYCIAANFVISRKCSTNLSYANAVNEQVYQKA
jgi:hypothetical protein